MTPTLTAAIVALITGLGGLVTALTIYVKTKTDTEKIRAERAETCRQRNSDSQELHDAVQRNMWDIQQLKDGASHRDTLIEDLQKQINILNSTLAVTNAQLTSLVDVIKEMKR